MNASFSKLFEGDSPGYIQCTQEGFENVDVIWDWNSPQSKKAPKKSQKRLALPDTPKKSLKRHISNNSIQGFEKIKEELRLLREEIAVPEHEESLILSPVEEAEYKLVNNPTPLDNIEFENFITENDDIFNDDLDDKLLICATQMDDKLKEDTKKASTSNSNLKTVNSDRNSVTNIQSNTPSLNTFKGTKQTETIDTINFNESILICHGDLNSQVDKNKPNNISIGRKEFHRTESFELSNIENLTGKCFTVYNDNIKLHLHILKVCQCIREKK